MNLVFTTGAPDLWEARASGELRISYQIGPQGIVLRNCGHHDDVLDNP